jgi:hypothetical protein
VLGGISYGTIRGMSYWFGWNIVAVKILVETSLSIVSFSLQRTFVFVDSSGSRSE